MAKAIDQIDIREAECKQRPYPENVTCLRALSAEYHQQAQDLMARSMRLQKWAIWLIGISVFAQAVSYVMRFIA